MIGNSASASRGGSPGTIRRLEDWLPVLLYTTLMGTLSSIPTLAPPTAGLVTDKAWHLVEYAGWGLLFRRALDQGRPRVTRRWLKMALTLATGSALAVLDENFQRMVGRQYAVEDMVADAAGLLLSLPIYELLSTRVRTARREAMRKGPDRDAVGVPGEETTNR